MKPRILRSVSLAAASAASILLASIASAQVVPIIEQGAEWKYLDTGEDLGRSNIVVGSTLYDDRNWKHPDFDDSSWKSGNASFGYGDPVTTEIEFGGVPGNRHATYYFRQTFSVTSSELNRVSLLQLGVRRDDGAIVYINGIEVARENMPAGVVDGTTLAPPPAVGGADEQRFFDTIVPLTILGQDVIKAGQNTIAVELHQQTRSSSDLIFDLFLTGSEQVPELGFVRPTVGSDLETYPNFGDVEQFRFPEDSPPNFEIEWQAAVTTQGFSGFAGVNDSDIEFFDPLDTGFAFTVNTARIVLETEPVNVANYTDVQISFDMRTFWSQGQFETQDYVRAYAETSTDGVNFTRNEFLTAAGGGSVVYDWTPVVANGDMKKFLVPGSAAEVPASWKTVGFDDSSWIEADKGAGYERSSGYEPYYSYDTESVMFGGSANSSCFVRVPFTIDDLGAVDSLRLGVQYDDGFVAYLNGTEVARANAPAGAPAWNASATANNPDTSATSFEYFDLKNRLNLLVEGPDNVLAIQGLNFNTSSSDFLISPILETGVEGEGTSLPAFGDNISATGPFRTVTSPPGFIQDSVQSVRLVIDAKCGDPSDNVIGHEHIFLDNFLVTGTPVIADTYEAFIALRTSLTGDDALAEADPDGDQIVNLLEYALGGDPEVPDPTDGPDSILPKFDFDHQSGFLQLSYRQLSGRPNFDPSLYPGYEAGDSRGNAELGFIANDVRYVVQESTDLVTWVDGRLGAAIVDFIPPFVDNGDEFTVTVNMRSRLPLNFEGTPRKYWRLLVERLQPPSYLNPF